MLVILWFVILNIDQGMLQLYWILHKLQCIAGSHDHWIPTMYQKPPIVPHKSLTIGCCYGCAMRLWNSLPEPGESLCPPTVFVWKEPHSPGDCHNIVVSKCIKARQGAVRSGDHQPSYLAWVQDEGITLIEITADSTAHSRYLTLSFSQRYYSDVIMDAMATQITSLTRAFIQAQMKENIKAPRHWPFWGEFTGDRRIPRTKGQ